MRLPYQGAEGMAVELQAGRLPAAKSVPKVQSGVLTFVRVKPHNIFKETPGKFPDVFVAAKTGVLSQNTSFSKPN